MLQDLLEVLFLVKPPIMYWLMNISQEKGLWLAHGKDLLLFPLQPHEDGPLYHPVVTTVSLGSHTLLDFYSQIADDTTNVTKNISSE